MSQYTRFLDYVSEHPGCTRSQFTQANRDITHLCEITRMAIGKGDVIVKKVDGIHRPCMGFWRSS